MIKKCLKKFDIFRLLLYRECISEELYNNIQSKYSVIIIDREILRRKSFIIISSCVKLINQEFK